MPQERPDPPAPAAQPAPEAPDPHDPIWRATVEMAEHARDPDVQEDRGFEDQPGEAG